MIGQTLGPYRVVAKLGEGGMGQVFRAHDTDLEREVAIKVLPDVWAGDPDRLARFRREAQLLASLNHPHIAQIYGVETGPVAANHTHTSTALVMELVDGPTLADRIADGPLPVPDAVAIARQIADALDAAHEHGIVHRDLKPANVKVREDGTVKVLDFGLAKNVSTVPATLSPSSFPTLTSPAMSQVGMILGTAAYMSPEQARGKAVDRRTDIWAFGCILFEMLAGRRPFDGEDVTETMASVVKAEPAWGLLPSNVPPRLVRLLKRCLEKDRRLRLRDIGDARFELNDDTADAQVVSATPAKSRWPERLAWVAALVVVTSLGAGAWFMRPAPATSVPVTRFSIVLPEGQRLNGALRRLAVSPDGRTIVYVANGQLYRRDLTDLEPHPIEGANDNPSSPEFSPDGQSIAYLTLDGTSNTFLVKRVPLAGGTPFKVIDVGSAAVTASWWNTADATITWVGDRIIGSSASGIWGAPDSGGAPQPLISVDPAVEAASSPRLIDERHVLFTVRRFAEAGPEASNVVVESVGGGGRKVLVRAGRLVTVLPTGHLVYVRGPDLMAVAFDERRLEISGDAVLIASGVGTQVTISRAGTIASLPAPATALRSPVWVDRHGVEESIPMGAQNAGYLRLSPDNTRLAFSGGSEIRIWTFDRKTMTRLNEAGGGQWDVAWMTDSHRIAFSAGANQASIQILLKAVDGSGPTSVILDAPAGFPNSVSPDGKFLLFHKGIGNLMLKPLDSAAPRALVKGIALNAVFSPDGHWIAYQSSEANRMEVFVRAFPDTESGRWQVSTSGGRYPLWSPDGGELFYVNAASRMVAVPVDTHGGFATGAATELFRTDQYNDTANSRPYDVSRDGKRFVFPKAASDARPTISVVTNWLQEVVAKVNAQQKAR